MSYCQKPDRDVPKLTCGYPRPCPWHDLPVPVEKATVIIDLSDSPPVVEALAPLTSKQRKRVRQIARALDPRSKP